MYAVDIDFAYNGSNEAHEIVEFGRDYGVKPVVVGRANGWPILHLTCDSRKVLEDILEARDEAWRLHEIDEISDAEIDHEHQDHPRAQKTGWRDDPANGEPIADADNYDDCPACRGMYGDGKII